MKKLLFIFLCAFVPTLMALDLLPLKGRINDYADLLTPSQERELNDYLASVEANTSSQMVFFSIPSLDGEILEEYSMRTAEAWKIGTKDQDNGLILVVAQAERKIRIEVGYGLESILSDGKCGSIIRQIMVPAFRSGDYYQGISESFKIMGAAIAGDSSAFTELEKENKEASPIAVWIGFITIFIFFSLIFRLGSRKGGRFYSSGGGWSSSSGSGFSGGGGSFGGGGASGSW